MRSFFHLREASFFGLRMNFREDIYYRTKEQENADRSADRLRKHGKEARVEIGKRRFHSVAEYEWADDIIDQRKQDRAKRSKGRDRSEFLAFFITKNENDIDKK